MLATAILVEPSSRPPGEQCPYEPYQGEGGDDYIIHGEYIVHFRANHTLDLHNSFMGYDVSSHPRFQLHNWLPGFCAKLDDYTFYELVRRDPGVVFVENNLKKCLVRPMDRTELKSPSKNTNSPLDKRYSSVLETIASWILRKIGAAGN